MLRRVVVRLTQNSLALTRQLGIVDSPARRVGALSQGPDLRAFDSQVARAPTNIIGPQTVQMLTLGRGQTVSTRSLQLLARPPKGNALSQLITARAHQRKLPLGCDIQT